jgi:hypothetical protein
MEQKMSNEYLTLTEALQYIADHYQDTVTRVTLYNWMNKGRKLPSGHIQFLKYKQSRCRRLIKTSDLDKFWQEEL